MFCFALKVELALLFLIFIYLQFFVIISSLGYIRFFQYHVSGLFHSTPAKAEMPAVTRLSLSPVIASNIPNERYRLPIVSSRYLHNCSDLQVSRTFPKCFYKVLSSPSSCKLPCISKTGMYGSQGFLEID